LLFDPPPGVESVNQKAPPDGRDIEFPSKLVKYSRFVE
jgi:hypothetical protein